MKVKKIVGAILVIGVMIWALMEQASEQPRIWVQVIGVGLFFLAMARLMQKTPSNTAVKPFVQSEFGPVNQEQEDGDYSITEVNIKTQQKQDVK